MQGDSEQRELGPDDGPEPEAVDDEFDPFAKHPNDEDPPEEGDDRVHAREHGGA